ncbi:15699_t:CDS:2, partial [Funneliformis geosporum]
MAKQPLANRVWTLAKHPQFFWWCGHCIVLFCTFFYFWSWITFSSSEGVNYYHVAYLGAMLSYGVVIYKSYGTPRLNWEYFYKINKDENIFYLMLAFMWFMSTPVFVTLIPYATFSLFHFITYFRTNILQTFFPPPHPSGPPGAQNEWVNRTSKYIQAWVHNNYDQAMKIVSFVEVVVITSFLLFNILTYHMNPYTREVFDTVTQSLDRKILGNPSVPPYLMKAYQHTKSAVIWFGNNHSNIPQSSRRG